jgi:small GTP-binding protein
MAGRPRKVVFVGNESVGKTAIVKFAASGTWNPRTDPTVGGGMFAITRQEKGGSEIMLQVWDTAGHERFETLVPMYLRSAQVAVLVFDVTNIESFRSIEKWGDLIREHSGVLTPIVLVGNKMDLEEQRTVSSEAGARIYASVGAIDYLETSALTGENIDALFTVIADSLPVDPVSVWDDPAIPVDPDPDHRPSRCPWICWC